MSEAEQSRDTAQEPQRDTHRSAAGSLEGRLLAGRYRLGEVLGRGGMGTVWRALDETLGRTVAVKELRFPSSIDEDEKRRLITRTLREAKAIARIKNSGAVTVYDVVDEDDRPWIVMELIEGKSLAELVREDGLLTPERAAEVGLAILDVLRSAHREGILHRDVKPSNVLMSEDGRVVLSDFGIAQVEGDPSVTSTGMLVGAPSYISPERARGHKPGPAADLWSLGGLLYAAVEGSPPYDKGSAIATLTAVMTEPVDPPKNAGAALEKVIYGLLVKDPAQRLDDAGARALLQDVLKPKPPERAPEPGPEATRVVPMPPAPPEKKAEKAAKPAGEATADRLLGALRSVRSTTAKPAPEPKAKEPPGTSPRPPRASLSDVVSRRTRVIIAVLAALAVLATILAIALSGGSDATDKGGQGTGGATASQGATAGDGSKDGSEDGTEEHGQTRSEAPGGGATAATGSAGQPAGSAGSSASGQPGKGGSGSSGGSGGDKDAGAVPAGYALITDRDFHYTMQMPKGFHRTSIAGQNSGGRYSLNGGVPRIQVDFTSGPTNDAKAAWVQQEAATRGSFSAYEPISIEKVAYNGYPTVADWQFRYTLSGVRVRVLNRGFKIDAHHGYAILIICKDSEWNGAACRTMRDTAFATFKPKD